MKRFLPVCLVGILFALVCPASQTRAQGVISNSNHYIQDFENGQVDWHQGMVTAIGIGAPSKDAENAAQARAMAKRAAVVLARRNLLEIIKGVRVDSQSTVNNYIVQSDLIRSSIRGHLKNSKILDVSYLADGAVEVKVGIKFHNGLTQTIFTGSGPAFRTDETPRKSDKTLISDSDPSINEEAETYTGLVVDARGLELRPAMSPKILDKGGTEIYGSAMVSREFALKQGIAGYAKETGAAKRNPRVANNPLVIQAISTIGTNNADLVISESDAFSIKKLAKRQNFLEQCRVMIVLD